MGADMYTGMMRNSGFMNIQIVDSGFHDPAAAQASDTEKRAAFERVRDDCEAKSV